MPAPVTANAHVDLLIYLVDDEESSLELAEVALLADGYELKKFQDPEEALEAFTRELRKPSLLLTDYSMGTMTGMELSTKCKSAHPGLKILMVSGTESPEVVHQAPGTIDIFMPKPYKLAELASSVRSLLSAA